MAFMILTCLHSFDGPYTCLFEHLYVIKKKMVRKGTKSRADTMPNI